MIRERFYGIVEGLYSQLYFDDVEKCRPSGLTMINCCSTKKRSLLSHFLCTQDHIVLASGKIF